jgi:hypothetical protein
MGLNLNCSCQKHVFLYNFVVICSHHFFTRVPYHDVSHGMTILWLLSSIICHIQLIYQMQDAVL